MRKRGEVVEEFKLRKSGRVRRTPFLLQGIMRKALDMQAVVLKVLKQGLYR
jgi:hypothetical protein